MKQSITYLAISTLAVASSHAASIVVYTENFEDGLSDFTSSTASSVIGGQLEIDLETRGNGTNFNNFSGIPIDLTVSNLDLSTLSSVTLAVDFRTVGANTAADTAAGFVGSDGFGAIVSALDAGGSVLGRYPGGGEFFNPRRSLGNAASYNVMESVTELGDLLTLFPTATQLEIGFIFREGGDGAGGGAPVGVAGNDFAIDNVVLTVEADVVPEPSSLLLAGLGALGLLRRRR